mmetsp:Transcript_80891/g.142634  ORF Transcript_80891/g.142634 Transcript_80891/m.142634 type:complete len:547 (-) Transcript_80891:14-1654(-)
MWNLEEGNDPGQDNVIKSPTCTAARCNTHRPKSSLDADQVGITTACLTIQRVWRGHRVRKQFPLRRQQRVELACQLCEEEDTIQWEAERAEHLAREEIIRLTFYRAWQEWARSVQYQVQDTLQRRHVAALDIQRAWKGYCVRAQYHHWLWERLVFQQADQMARAVQQERDDPSHLAARQIQKAWRAYISTCQVHQRRLEQLLEAEEGRNRSNRILHQEEAYHRNRLSEWEVDERRAVYQVQMYHRLAVEFVSVEERVREMVVEDAAAGLAQLQLDWSRAGQAAVDRSTAAAVLIQAHWRGYSVRRDFAARRSQRCELWEQRCAADDAPVIAAEQAEFAAEALTVLTEVEALEAQEWAALTADADSRQDHMLQAWQARAAAQIQFHWRWYCHKRRQRQAQAQLEAHAQEEYETESRALVELMEHEEATLLQLMACEALQWAHRRAVEAEWHWQLQALQQVEHTIAVERTETAARQHLEETQYCTLQWICLAAVQDRHRLKALQYKAVTTFVAACVALHFHSLGEQRQAVAALIFAEESGRTVLQVER